MHKKLYGIEFNYGDHTEFEYCNLWSEVVELCREKAKLGSGNLSIEVYKKLVYTEQYVASFKYRNHQLVLSDLQ